jgi:hypothetical protein
MCISLATAALIAGAATAVGSIYQADQAASAARDAKKERQRAEAQAAQRANAEIAMRRKAMQEQSLFTGAGDAGTGGRQTLGV